MSTFAVNIFHFNIQWLCLPVSFLCTLYNHHTVQCTTYIPHSRHVNTVFYRVVQKSRKMWDLSKVYRCYAALLDWNGCSKTPGICGAKMLCWHFLIPKSTVNASIWHYQKNMPIENITKRLTEWKTDNSEEEPSPCAEHENEHKQFRRSNIYIQGGSKKVSCCTVIDISIARQ